MEKKPSVLIWLTASCLCTGLLADFIQTTISGFTGKELGVWPALLTEAAASLLSLVCFAEAAVSYWKEESPESEHKPDFVNCLLGGMPCILILDVFTYAIYGLLPVVIMLYDVGIGVFAGIMALTALILTLLLGSAFLCWMNRCRQLPMRHPIRRYFQKIYLGIPMGLLLLGAFLIVPVLESILNSIWTEPADVVRHLVLFISSLIMTGLMVASVCLAGKILAGTEGDAEYASRPFRKKYLSQLVSLGICVILFASQNWAPLTGSASGVLNEELRDYLLDYSFYLYVSDMGDAAAIAEEALTRMDEEITEAETALKETEEDSSEAKKAEKKLAKLEKVCERYDLFRSDGQALICLEEYYQNGGADKDLVEDALELAEEYMEDFEVQYTASLLGSSLTYDGAGHYDATSRAILRCNELYQADSNHTDEDCVTFTKEMAQMLIQVYCEEDAADLLEALAEEAGEDNLEICELLAQCYDRLEDTERSYTLATEYCSTHEDSPYLLYLAALASLKLEKVDECLNYTSALASYTAACEGEDLTKCDIWLFEMLEYLTLSDNAQYTGFQRDIYEDLTEEENALIDQNPFFRNYLDAVYLAYESDHKDEPEDALTKMQSVIDTNQDLACAWYLCGIIASNTQIEAYQDCSVEYYQIAGELNSELPAVWYAMAREYDRMGEYQKGIEACKKALALLPEQDHGSDWYGINYHCSRLLNSLETAVANGEG